MNKRLKELAMIAADNWNLTFEDHKFLEKFAELITKESIQDLRALALAAYVAKSKKTGDTNERWQASVEAVLKEVRIDIHWQASVEAVLEVRGFVNNPFEYINLGNTVQVWYGPPREPGSELIMQVSIDWVPQLIETLRKIEVGNEPT